MSTAGLPTAAVGNALLAAIRRPLLSSNQTHLRVGLRSPRAHEPSASHSMRHGFRAVAVAATNPQPHGHDLARIYFPQ